MNELEGPSSPICRGGHVYNIGCEISSQSVIMLSQQAEAITNRVSERKEKMEW